MQETDFSNVELILHVKGDGTEENLYRKMSFTGDWEFYNAYSHIGIDIKDVFWAGKQDLYSTWNEFWSEFTELDEWWFYYKPIIIHKDYKDFILKELLIISENIDSDADKGYYNKWRELCTHA